MNEPVHTLDVRDFMTRHLLDVLDTMLARKGVPIDPSSTPGPGDRICGSVGFAGEKINGVVYLHLSASFAISATTAMLGLSAEELNGDSEANDVVGEMTNMLAGGLKSALCDHGAPCAVSTPSIIRGSSFEVEPVPDVERFWLPFQCGDDRVFVEVHIKSN
jgi:CheY-specific phosphatase CheX